MSGSPDYLLDRPGERVDPLSEVLALLDVRAAVPSRLEAGGRWALRFGGNEHVKLGAVLAGQCWVTADRDEPVFLRTGDGFSNAFKRVTGHSPASHRRLVPQAVPPSHEQKNGLPAPAST
jgi:hypothetical protein